MSRVVGNLNFLTKKYEMPFYCREKHLLASLYVLVCRFVGVAAMSWISLRAYIWFFRENLLGKRSFVKIGPKLSALFTWRPEYASMYSATYRKKTLPSKGAESDFFCSRRRINITQIPHNVMYNVPFLLVLNWPAVELVTLVHCVYQQRRSRDWSVILSPDIMTLDGMPHRRKYTIWFVLIFTESMLPTLRIVSVRHECLWWLCKAMFTTVSFLLVLTAYSFTFAVKHICHSCFCERTEQGREQK
jgi:hypothetical protein